MRPVTGSKGAPRHTNRTQPGTAQVIGQRPSYTHRRRHGAIIATYRRCGHCALLAHDRRRIRHFAVTAHPTAAWATQRSAKRPWDEPPRYLLHDRDHSLGRPRVPWDGAAAPGKASRPFRGGAAALRCAAASSHHPLNSPIALSNTGDVQMPIVGPYLRDTVGGHDTGAGDAAQNDPTRRCLLERS
jgi:hypothetical protein